MLGKNKSAGFAVLSIVLVLAAGLAVSGCGCGAAPKPAKVYKVTFEASGGEPVPEAQLVEAGSKIELPKTMARTKFTFSGWYKDLDCKEPWDFANDTVEGDIILFANWKSAAGNSGGGGGGSSGGGGRSPGGGGIGVNTNTANVPTITLQPKNASYEYLATPPADLTIVASGNGTLSYEWFENTVNSTSGGTSVGTGDSYPPSDALGDTYYYCIVTNTKGVTTATKTSSVAMVSNRNGSSLNPLIVDSDELLKKIGTGTWGLDLCYEQTGPINLNYDPFTKIGGPGLPFTGSYNGNGHAIDCLDLASTGPMFTGLFGFSTGEVKNVRLTNCAINVNDANVGALVGVNSGTGTVRNCSVEGIVKANTYVGGLVGNNTGTIINCFFRGSVSASLNYVGGVVGSNNGTVTNCYASGIYATDTVGTTAGDGIGGVAGSNIATITNCVALHPKVESIGSNVGRVIGLNSAGTNNYARSTMIVEPATGTWSGMLGGSTMNGEDVVAADYEGANSDTWWSSTANFPASAWNFEKNKLPTLKLAP